ncbi:hypothetical protein HYT53_05900 [Candidatus Woesearchaeota archaeon]|nr:hypothetical protein [Candidatus Woesearchaeota archaeon]
MASVADFVSTDKVAYTSLLRQIRESREFPYIATSLAKLLSREEGFVRSLLGAHIGALQADVLPAKRKESRELDREITLGIRYMLDGEYEESHRHFLQARSISRDKGVTFALSTVGNNILNASTIYNAALSHVKSQREYGKK